MAEINWSARHKPTVVVVRTKTRTKLQQTFAI